MSAPKHTPGPWFVEMSPSLGTEGVRILWDVHSTDRVGIARSQSQEHLGNSGIHEGECRANARLIAAAPDLLEALQALDLSGHTPAVWDLAKRAMAKATGGDA
jgi:hypothetical protein